jgi:hypothetical protein
LVARLLFGSFDLVGFAAHVEGVEEGLGGLDCRFFLGYRDAHDPKNSSCL